MGWITKAILFNFVVVAAFAYEGAVLRWPDLINKGGASLSAFGALFVIYQAVIEARIEHREKKELEELEKLTPVNREIAAKYIGERTERRRNERIQVVIAIAVTVCVGELMHGWGEFLYFGGVVPPRP